MGIIDERIGIWKAGHPGPKRQAENRCRPRLGAYVLIPDPDDCWGGLNSAK